MGILLLVAQGGLACSVKDGILEPPPMAKQVEVWLGESVNKIKGFKYLCDDDGRLPPFAGEPKPYEVTVHFPSGRKFKCSSKYLLISQQKGTVTEVTFAPPANDVTFYQAVAIAEQEAKKVKFDEPWDLFERLKDWSKRTLPEVTVAAKGIVEERVTLFIQMRMGLGQKQHLDAGWWTTFDFHYWIDKEIWEAYKKP